MSQPSVKEIAERILNHDEYDFNYTDLLDESLNLARAYLELRFEVEAKQRPLSEQVLELTLEITKLKEEVRQLDYHNSVLSMDRSCLEESFEYHKDEIAKLTKELEHYKAEWKSMRNEIRDKLYESPGYKDFHTRTVDRLNSEIAKLKEELERLKNGP